MTLAVVQMRAQVGQPRKNAEKMLKYIFDAKTAGAEAILFPELALTGPVHDELACCDNMLRDCRAAAEMIADASEGIRIVFGTLEMAYGRVFSRLYMAKDHDLRPLFAAAAPPSWLGGPPPYPADVVPFDLIIDGEYRKVMPLLGDWYGQKLPADPMRADITICFTPQPVFAGEGDIAPESCLPSIFLSQLGLFASGKSNYVFAGHSIYYAADGEVLAATPYYEEGVYYWHWQGGDKTPELSDDQRLTQGLIHGAGEFCRSINAQRAVIGISGGIDSALAACVYRQALGPENVYLISMPSHFNSETTKSLAQGMAEGLGLPFATMPINDGCQQLYEEFAGSPFTDAAGKQLAVPLSGPVKENIMARERCRILAAAAAGLGGIFTCNGNKAELSVGYATFYGDLAGAFAAQADLWKYQVYQAAACFQQQFPDAPLDKIAAIRPSAELSAAQDVNKGLGDPLTYDYHDYLLRYWVDNSADPADNLRAYRDGFLARQIGCNEDLVRHLFPDAAAFVADIERWWKQYRGIGVAKRLQAPPLLALSRHPFGEGKPQCQGLLFFSDEFKELKAELLS